MSDIIFCKKYGQPLGARLGGGFCLCENGCIDRGEHQSAADISMYPPIPESELRNCKAFNGVMRVVVTHNGIYGRAENGQWAKFVPLIDVEQTSIPTNTFYP